MFEVFCFTNVRIYIKSLIMLDQQKLNELIVQLKKYKYKNIIQDLQLDHCTDEYGDYIQLTSIRIKKSQMNNGYGSAIMSEIVRLADNHNVRIKLWVTNIFRSDLKKLFEFYQKHGFTIDTTQQEGNMTYYPEKKRRRKSLGN